MSETTDPGLETRKRKVIAELSRLLELVRSGDRKALDNIAVTTDADLIVRRAQGIETLRAALVSTFKLEKGMLICPRCHGEVWQAKDTTHMPGTCEVAAALEITKGLGP